tara:strand:- start:259 stop:954 length:696 start_codon:yes stop_codon:yes gene_type:complete
MKCVIMQPAYFPWAGYFYLIAESDKFVFLDDVQYSKGSWQSKNFIISNKKKLLLTVPTKKSPLDTNIKDKIIDNSLNFQKKHCKSINQVYANFPFFKDLEELINFYMKLNSRNLSELNTEIIIFISKKLNLNTNFYYSSNFNFEEKRTKKVIQILKKLNATEYLSPLGAKEYLKEDNFLKLTDIKLSFSSFKSTKYNQKNLEDFVENLSIIDVIANLGWINTESYVKENKF